jgi:DNA-binding beta-propeller fold protein YncE
MHSVRRYLSRSAVAPVAAVALALVVGVDPLVTGAAGPGGPASAITFTKVWTHGHETEGQVAEIPAFDRWTNTIWVAGVVGVDVLNAATGALVDHIDVTSHGAVNSVAIRNGLAALAVEAPSQTSECPSCDRRNPGKVLLYNAWTRAPLAGVSEIWVGSLPDMLTFTHDGRKLLVANEGTPNVAADEDYASVDPPGSVSIIDVRTRSVVATALLDGVPTAGTHLRMPVSTGMDFEPEYIAVSEDDTKAFVTVQDANAVAVLDLDSNEFTRLIGLGAKDFSLPGNEIDPKDNDGVVSFQSHAAKGFYMPDAIAAYKWRGRTFTVMANEGDFREDDGDRSAASTFGAVAPLDRLRVSNKDSAPGQLFAAGARSFSIRNADGEIVYDSGSILDREAHARLIYDNGRSRDKGVEPEGVALLEIGGRTYAFIGLERTTTSAVAVFDITNPRNVSFVDMIVTPGDLAPEGLVAYQHWGRSYLAIANEAVASGGTTSNTTLYRVSLKGSSHWDGWWSFLDLFLQ